MYHRQLYNEIQIKFSPNNHHIQINTTYLETKKSIPKRTNHNFRHSCFSTSNLCIKYHWIHTPMIAAQERHKKY